MDMETHGRAWWDASSQRQLWIMMQEFIFLQEIYVTIVRFRDGCYFGFLYVIVAKSPVVTGPVLAKHWEQRPLALLLHYLQL